MTISRLFTKPIIFVALCAISLIFLSPIGGGFTFLGLLLVFTWPLLLIMFAAPSLVILWVITLIMRRLIAKTKTGPNLWVSIGLALLLMAIPPFWADQGSRAKTTALLASDLDNLEPPEKIETLGLIVLPNWREDDPNICGELCLRLLLNGEVGRVIIAAPPDVGEPINWQQMGSAYSFQPSEGCRNAATGYNGLSLDVSGQSTTADRDEVDAVLLVQQSLGNCLTKSQMPIGAADAAIFYAPVADGPGIYEAGLAYFADTAKAKRLAYFQKNAAGMALVYQRTVASYTRHFPIFAFSQNLQFGGTAASRLGFLGWETYVGEGSERWLPIDAMPFLTNRLGLKLRVFQLNYLLISMQKIAATLATDGRISPARIALVDRFIDIFSRTAEPTQIQAELVLKIWADPRIQLSNQAAMAARAISDTFPELEPKVAETLFSRLANMETDFNTNAVKTRQRSVAATALSTLRTSALAPYAAQIERLAARDDIGTTALPVIARLGDFGSAGIPPLLKLLDHAGLLPDGSRFQSGSNWARTYEAAINGLCRAAFSADPAIDKAEVRAALESRLNAGVIVNRSDNQISTLGMLLAFGVDQETLWLFFRNTTAPQARAGFLQKIHTASTRPGCPTSPHP